MDILKTRLDQFDSLADFPFKSNYIDFEGLNVHYIDEGTGDPILALHAESSWSYSFRKVIEPLTKNSRFIAPDLIGFGKSDKLRKSKNHHSEFHFRSLKYFIQELELNNITLLAHGVGAFLGLLLLGESPQLFKRLILMDSYFPFDRKLSLPFRFKRIINRYSPFYSVGSFIKNNCMEPIDHKIIKAYNLPFKKNVFKSGPRSITNLYPTGRHTSETERILKTKDVLSNWSKPCLVMFSDQGRFFKHSQEAYRNNILAAKDIPEIKIKNAGFCALEDQPMDIVNYINMFFNKQLNLT